MSGRMIHVSQEMMPNVLWPRAGAPFVRGGKPQTYFCRDGQVRGKAAKKRAKRVRMATRMRDFWLLAWWCAGVWAYLFWAEQYDAKLTS